MKWNGWKAENEVHFTQTQAQTRAPNAFLLVLAEC